MNTKTLRIVIPLAVLAVIAVGFAAGAGVGTLSAIGWGEISLLCPLGALGTMLASKTMVPRAVVSLIFAVIAIVLLGRAFCAWVCPVPVVQKLRGIFKKGGSNKDASAGKASGGSSDTPGATGAPASDPTNATLTAASSAGCSHNCASCAQKHAEFDSRHVILGGSLLTAAVFGFPVFCLVCPIGLTTATVFLLILLFSNGDVTWTVLIAPLVLALEVVFFKKWCSKICPLSAFMSLIGKANRTFVPAIDDEKCLETSRHAACGRCAEACEQQIDIRHPELSPAQACECTKCRACVDACPMGAVSMPFLPKRTAKASDPVINPIEQEELAAQ